MAVVHCAVCGQMIDYIDEGNTYELVNLYGSKQTLLRFNACPTCLNKIIQNITDFIAKEENQND